MKQKSNEKMLIALMIATFFVLAINSYSISQINSISTGYATARVPVLSEVIPTGTPEKYGDELGISFDDVSPNDRYKADSTIRKLGNIDREVTLTGEDKERYINILYKLNDGISCEYCCGARAIIFSDGEPACGCAHSYAMRGLTKHLITNYGSEYTDEEILEEAGKWKTLFFPTQITQKAAILKGKGVELNYINLASNKYRGIEKGSTGGGMVGGC